MQPAHIIRLGLLGLVLAALMVSSATVQSDPVYTAGTPPVIAQSPLYVKDAVPPLNMLVMGKDHKIYYEAYNDASDLNGDGSLDVGYRGWELKSPAPSDSSSKYKIDYYGYFNSYACYSWDASNNRRFYPVSATANKQCSGSWSGDFLNYLTTSRMDALRRVLYGGWRQSDTATETVLQGAFFPQDAHSWGKEYQNATRDGYNIANYAPLTAPGDGKYHLFAVTTLADDTSPVFRVMQNSEFRIWNWLSIEGPVAGNKCFTSGNSRVDCLGNGASEPHPGHPDNRTAFDTLETNYAIPANLFGSGSISQINCTSDACNPFGNQDNYLTLMEGTFHVGNGNGSQGDYQFSIDGDDAVDFQISRGNTLLAQAGYYGGHDVCNCNSYLTAPVSVERGDDLTFRFRHEEAGGGDKYILRYRKVTVVLGAVVPETSWEVVPGGNGEGNTGLRDVTIKTYNLTPSLPGSSSRQDYAVRVLSCPDTPADARESTCKQYGDHYKPTGILHDYGENQKMYFGLITGSQRNNLEGGVLRSNVSNFANEVNATTGQFQTVDGQPGIAANIDSLRMIGGGYNNGVADNAGGDTNWNWANTAHGAGGNCESQGGRSLNNGECRMWGNPIAEMMFEGLRYFAGAAVPTTRFSAASNNGSSEGTAEDNLLGLSSPSWKDPYKSTSAEEDPGLGYPTCAKPYETVISDINPSYDGNLPGSAFATVDADASLPGFNASGEGNAIWSLEYGASRKAFIGEVAGATDGAPTAKTVSGFGNIRGLAPEEPTREGTYYSASVARYGRYNDINPTAKTRLSTYSIALASPLPRIEVPLGTGTVTLLPFAKTVSGTYGDSARKPTNTIVDFYVQEINNFPGQPTNVSINNGRPKAIFRINYEDVEQGNDHDMDAIARYEVAAKANGTLDVQVISEYAAGSANQYMGYTLSGSNGKDGVYLEICDLENNKGNPSNSTDKALCASSNTVYRFNTPPGRDPGYCDKTSPPADCAGLPPTSSIRNFSPGAGSNAIQLEDPLWYAAKYGAPDPTKWDQNADGDPDNYFLVTNPLNLREQLSKAFDDIANRNLDQGSSAVSGARVGDSSFQLQASFGRERGSKDWFGDLIASSLVTVDGRPAVGPVLWRASDHMPAPANRNIKTMVGSSAKDFQASELGTNDVTRFDALGVANSGGVSSTAKYGYGYTPEQIVAYLRGDQSREASDGSVGNTLRVRSSIIGDIVNSEPTVFSPKSNFGYGYYSDPMFSGYAGGSGYLTTKTGRKPIAFVGANDGMLHAFDASTVPCGDADSGRACATSSSGEEMFAYIPRIVLDGMGQLPMVDAQFSHRYFVDGQLTVGDAKNGAWKTLLVGSVGAGSQAKIGKGGGGIFALDITRNVERSGGNAFGTDQVLWEYDDGDNDVGAIYGKPLLVPLENNKWGVLFGNGYGGARSDPSLYILDAFTGAPIKKLVADDGNIAVTFLGLPCGLLDVILGCRGRSNAPYNGLGQITAIDRDNNGKIDTIYGGDLQGNLWKFDLSNGNASNWKVGFANKPLFTAQNAAGRQAITGGVRIALGPGVGYMVYFGTGRYFTSNDNEVGAQPQVQSLYAVWDSTGPTGGEGPSERTRADLAPRILTERADDASVRDISGDAFSFGSTRGWYVDLAVGATGLGERVVGSPRIQDGKVYYPSYTPTLDNCSPGGKNFTYIVDYLTGGGAASGATVTPGGGTLGGTAGGVQGNDGAPVTTVDVLEGSSTGTLTGSDDECPADDPNCTVGKFKICTTLTGKTLSEQRSCGRQSWRQLK